ncbi:hypothetical protein ES332_A02G102200v1 [Gossypium tomentosum]|uniref:Protein DCL, chloroplastic n=1 Tax=Gossypium tomentosum TaxID=34277 RepID=A0A5D2RH49_GOSTO|nr:hypothetical protein ES332_A02G102200v1 [Gossypium tomentosum]
MAAHLLRKGIPLLRLRLQRYNLLAAGIPSSPRRPWCAAAESTGLEEEVSSAEKSSAVPSVRDPKKYHMLDDPDYRKWKDKEEEILRDIQPIISLAREILHSNRYKDGERLTVADEEAVVEMLLRYHPHSEDKIGCGLDSIMVDRHPQFRWTRCLFVVRTDGGWIDFSYHKCLRAYIRDKYPSLAERFIGEHFRHRRLHVKSWLQDAKVAKYRKENK